MVRQITRERCSFFTLTPYSHRESILSITQWDYSAGLICLDQFLKTNSADQNIVISSSILASLEVGSALQLLKNGRANFRIQVSWGTEFQKYHSWLLEFMESGGAVDVLIDRPLGAGAIEELDFFVRQFNVRLCVIANKYFDLIETVRSFGENLKKHLVVLFLPPKDEKSFFLSPDEVIEILQNWSFDGDLKLLIFENIIRASSQIRDFKFFLELDPESYLSGAMILDKAKNLRLILIWALRKKLVGLLDFTYGILIFLKAPSWQGFLSPLVLLRNWLRQALVKLSWSIFNFVRYSLFHFFRYKVPHYFRVTFVHFFRYKVPHYFRVTFIHFFRYQAPHFVRVRIINTLLYRTLPQAKWFLIRCWDWLKVFIRYRMPHGIRVARNLLLFPFFKIYWFSSYQFQTRILPYFKKGLREK